LFEGQYTELFEAIDAIAERIRSLGDYALPFEGDNILQISKMTSNSLNKEDNANDRADRMVNNLIALNEAVINHCQAAKNICRDVKDDETENMIVERVTIHQKAIWMLRSVLK
ncbi:MAG: ferritin-like domain-containing protein, partial [Pseudomonadota bacterium]